MKSRLIIIILLVFSLSTEAQVRRTTIRAFWQTVRNTISGETPTPPPIEKAFYVSSSSGSDSNPGTLAEPFQTLDKINSLALTDTSKVYLKRGDSFIGTLTVQSDSITYDAYGTGAKPKIYGSDVISGSWTVHSGNIYKKTGVAAITQLFVNGNRAKFARYPKLGYAKITTVNTTTQLTSTEIPSESASFYVGAKATIKSAEWSVDAIPVTASTGNTITLSDAPTYGIKLNWGFFLSNKLEFLTEAGEWHYDNATSTLYAWMPNNDSPDNYEIRGSIRDYGIYISGKDYIKINNIDISQFKNTGVLIDNSDNCTVSNTWISDVVSNGVRIAGGSSYATVTNNTITNVQTNGVRSYGNNNKIEDNTITNIGIIDNITSSSTFKGYGIYHSEGTLCSIKRNYIENVGYNGISFDENATYTTVENNYVGNGLVSLSDGGGIYCWVRADSSKPVTGSSIKNNIVENMVGNIEGTTSVVTGASGIYLDDRVAGVEVSGNTVKDISYFGYFLHNNKNVIVNNNTAYNVGRGVVASTDFSADNVEFKNNIIYNLPTSPTVSSVPARVAAISGTINFSAIDLDNNTFVDRTRSKPFRGTTMSAGDYNKTLADWQTETGWDASSVHYSTALGAGESERILINPTKSAKTFYVNNATSVKKIDGTGISESVVIPAYGSLIVTGKNLDCIHDYSDAVAPTITAFTLPVSSELTVTPTLITATGGATAYKITESNTSPTLDSSGWSITPTGNVTSEGSKTLYLWARDAAGNISSSSSASTTVTGTPVTIGTTSILSLTSGTANAERAYPVTVTENTIINSISIYHTAGNGTEKTIGGIYADDSNKPGSLLATTAQTVITGSTEWQTINFVTPIYVLAGTKIWIGWNKGTGTSQYYYEEGSVTRATKTKSFGELSNPYGTADTYADYSYSINVNGKQ